MTYQVEYWCANCRERFKASFEYGKEAPQIIKCLRCGNSGAVKCW